MAKDPIALPYSIGPHLVTGVWRYMLPAELSTMAIPLESRSTCMNCPKVVSDGYRADYRCCTYFPRIPNFLIGLALNHDPKARQLLETMISNGFMTPEGMIPTPQRWASYVSEVGEENFGKSSKVLCSLLDQTNGYCGVYAFRNAVCSTFFCHNDHGSKGGAFWEAVQTVASQCELALSQWVMGELGVDAAAYFSRMNKLTPGRVTSGSTQAWNKHARRALWGDWYERESAFFAAAGKLIADHRHELWEIANRTPIAEAKLFERQALACVPREHRESVADDFGHADEESEAESPLKLWEEVKKAHARLWAIPGGPLGLSPRVTITTNPALDPEERFYGQFSHMVSLSRRSGSKATQWRQFVDAPTAEALGIFKTPQMLSTPFLQSLLEKLPACEPLHFISEWHHKKILTSP